MRSRVEIAQFDFRTDSFGVETQKEFEVDPELDTQNTEKADASSDDSDSVTPTLCVFEGRRGDIANSNGDRPSMSFTLEVYV